MPSSFSPNLRLELIGAGEQAGTWGTTTNTNLGTLIEDAISGYVAVTISSANQALTAVNGAADQARNAMVQFNSASGAFSVYAPPESKQYVLFNNTAHAATIYNSSALGNTTAAGTGVTIPAGKTVTVWSDGTNFAFQSTYAPPSIIEQVYPVGSIYINATNNTNPGTLLGFGTWAAFGAGRVPVGFDAGNANFNAAEKTGGTQDAITVAHTHTFSGTTGGQSADHAHSGITSSNGAHAHNFIDELRPMAFSSPSNTAGLGRQTYSIASTIGGPHTTTEGVHNHSLTTGGVSSDHNHAYSGTTASTGSSGTNANLQPYITVYMWKRTA